MGWFGTGPLDGDPGMDAQDELFGFIGVQYDDECNILTSYEEIANVLDKRQDDIYDYFGEFICSPYFYHVVAAIYHEYNVPLNIRGLRIILPEIKNDEWSNRNTERAKSMKKLYDDAVNDTFSLYVETHPELFV